MRRTLLLFLLLLMVGSVSAQAPNAWAKWQWLLGEWQGAGEGKPGEGSGTFSFAYDLNQKVLIRRGATTFPASGDRPASIHSDLMVIYLGGSSEPAKAVYFDNEGHTISYSISYDGNSIVLTSDRVDGAPVFRLTYSSLGDKEMNTKFEMSRDGVSFATYIQGRSVRR